MHGTCRRSRHGVFTWWIAAVIWLLPLAAFGQTQQSTDDVRAAQGLVALGISTMVIGGAMAAAGVTVNSCSTDEPECVGSHFGNLFGGIGLATLGAGLGQGIGLRMWKRALGPEHDSGPRADPALFAAGVTISTLGGASAAAGFLMSLAMGCTASDPGHCTYGLEPTAQAALLAVGFPVMAVGIPLASLGGRRLGEPTRGGRPMVTVGPGTFAAHLEF
jgi:hypothetical protein